MHPLIHQAVVVGDNRPCVGALITLDPDFLAHWRAAEPGQSATVPDGVRDQFRHDQLQVDEVLLPHGAGLRAPLLAHHRLRVRACRRGGRHPGRRPGLGRGAVRRRHGFISPHGFVTARSTSVTLSITVSTSSASSKNPAVPVNSMSLSVLVARHRDASPFVQWARRRAAGRSARGRRPPHGAAGGHAESFGKARS
ncbi:hypothetical protein SALBM311S_00266 [Streptomyces alboniger]